MRDFCSNFKFYIHSLIILLCVTLAYSLSFKEKCSVSNMQQCESGTYCDLNWQDPIAPGTGTCLSKYCLVLNA